MCARVLTQVQRVCVGPVGERGALVHLLQQLLLHLGDGVTVQHLGGQGLGLVYPPALHQHVQSLDCGEGRLGPERDTQDASI